MKISMEEYIEKTMNKLASYGETYSYGVKLLKKEEWEAWINYKPPYDNTGGNWCEFAETKQKAVQALFKRINEYRKHENIK